VDAQEADLSAKAALELELDDGELPDAELVAESTPELELSKDDVDCELAWFLVLTGDVVLDGGGDFLRHLPGYPRGAVVAGGSPAV